MAINHKWHEVFHLGETLVLALLDLSLDLQELLVSLFLLLRAYSRVHLVVDPGNKEVVALAEAGKDAVVLVLALEVGTGDFGKVSNGVQHLDRVLVAVADLLLGLLDEERKIGNG